MGLVQESYVWRVAALAHHFTINFPVNVLGCPFNRVVIKTLVLGVSLRLEILDIRLIMLSILPDDICAHWVIIDRRHYLYVDLVPLGRILPRAFPVGEECSDSAWVRGSLHLRAESAILEGFPRLYFATHVLSLCDGGQGQCYVRCLFHSLSKLFLL